MVSRKAVLLVGGGGQRPPSDGPPLPSKIAASHKSPEDLKRTLKAMIDQAAEMGCDVRVMQLHTMDQDEALSWADGIREALASQSWDGFIIGNGIRGTPSLTLVFEKLVKVTREVAPDTAMGFNSHPGDVIDTIRRLFPEKG